MHFSHNIGFLLLGIWLILWGLVALGLGIPSIIMAILAIAAGIFILLDR